MAQVFAVGECVRDRPTATPSPQTAMAKKSVLAPIAAAFVTSFAVTSLPAVATDMVVEQSTKKKEGSGSGE